MDGYDSGQSRSVLNLETLLQRWGFIAYVPLKEGDSNTTWNFGTISVTQYFPENPLLSYLVGHRQTAKVALLVSVVLRFPKKGYYSK